ncbi:MAG: hypothetical protein GF350_02085 [Chitinivibrionales bacterium]|nr:hypothetical protein [Chitinivibrionales bacterium]
MKEVLEQSGTAGKISTHTIDNPPRYFRYYFEDESRGYSIDNLLESYNEWKKQVPPHIRQKTDRLFNFQLPERILPLAETQNTINRLFKDASAGKKSTVWVAANDDIALWALEFLHRKKISCPGRISVVGFDDTHAAMNRGLTSFNFNMRAFAHLMLSFVLNKRSVRQPPKNRAVELDGMVIERRTVSRTNG